MISLIRHIRSLGSSNSSFCRAVSSDGLKLNSVAFLFNLHQYVPILLVPVSRSGMPAASQVENVLVTSDSHQEATRHELRRTQGQLADTTSELAKTRQELMHTRDGLTQLQKQAQFTERSLIVAEKVITRERQAAMFQRWQAAIWYARELYALQRRMREEARAQSESERVQFEASTAAAVEQAVRRAEEQAGVRAHQAELTWRRLLDELSVMAQEDCDLHVLNLQLTARAKLEEQAALAR